MTGLSSCTKKFEEYNTNPFGVSDADLNPDGALIVASLQNAERSIYVSSPAWGYAIATKFNGRCVFRLYDASNSVCR